MLNTLSRPQPWYTALIARLNRLLVGQPKVDVIPVVTGTERIFPIAAEQAHLYARSADEFFYREITVSSYQRLPPVKMREYRW